MLVGRTCIVVAPGLFTCRVQPDRHEVPTVSIMTCQTFAQELADLPSFNSIFKALTKEELIVKVRKALQVCSIANIVINKQNDVIIKYMEEKLETGTSLTDGAIAPAPVAAPTSAPAPVSTTAKKSFASIVKTTQPIIVKPSDSDAAVASKEEMLSKANEALKKVNVRNARVTNKGTLVVEVSSENDREGAVSRLKEGLSEAFVVEGANNVTSKTYSGRNSVRYTRR